MPRIAGVNIPENKQIAIALTYVYGIGRSLACQILEKAKVDKMKKAKDLSEKELGALREIIEAGHSGKPDISGEAGYSGKADIPGEAGYSIEGDLRQTTMRDIRRLKDIKCWRGIRHLKGLPVRGQKTRKNSRTVRGNVRKTVGSGKKAAPAPK